MQEGKGIVIGKCPRCEEVIEIDLIEKKVYGGKFETVSDEKWDYIFITCPKCGHREKEHSLTTKIV